VQGERPAIGEPDAPVTPGVRLGGNHRREHVAQRRQIVVGGEAGELEKLGRQDRLAVDERLDRPGGDPFGGARSRARDDVAGHAAAADRYAHARPGLARAAAGTESGGRCRSARPAAAGRCRRKLSPGPPGFAGRESAGGAETPGTGGGRSGCGASATRRHPASMLPLCENEPAESETAAPTSGEAGAAAEMSPLARRLSSRAGRPSSCARCWRSERARPAARRRARSAP
jgi:hypothetical protein